MGGGIAEMSRLSVELELARMEADLIGIFVETAGVVGRVGAAAALVSVVLVPKVCR